MSKLVRYDEVLMKYVIEVQCELIEAAYEEKENLDAVKFISDFMHTKVKKALDEGNPRYFNMAGYELLDILRDEQKICLYGTDLDTIDCELAKKIIKKYTEMSHEYQKYSSELIEKIPIQQVITIVNENIDDKFFESFIDINMLPYVEMYGMDCNKEQQMPYLMWTPSFRESEEVRNIVELLTDHAVSPIIGQQIVKAFSSDCFNMFEGRFSSDSESKQKKIYTINNVELAKR